jgi:Rod binding domain-containing protein
MNAISPRQFPNALTAPVTPDRRVAVVRRDQVDPAIVEAAEGMEAMFLNYMMNVMRETVPKNELDMNNGATQIYQGMLDTQTAQKAAKHGGVGLADQLIAYLVSERYTLKKEHGAPESVQGGTHAGQPARK